MSNTKLLKEAIADAKTVRETAIANAKIALEEAFTPKLQSMLSKQIQEEMDDEDTSDEDEVDTTTESTLREEEDSDEEETDDDDLNEEEESDDDEDLDLDEILREMGYDEFDLEEEDDMELDMDDLDLDEEDDMEFDLEEEDEFDVDLEEIIRELEDEYDDEDLEESEIDGVGYDDPTNADDASLEETDFVLDLSEIFTEDEDEDDLDDELDLDEILREMGYGDDEDELTEEEDEDDTDQMKSDLEEAYRTIKSLKSTINEVNLLNAKLLYSNKLFRGYELTNEQKRKVIDTIDRTSNIREVKLVFSTLAESFKMNETGTGLKRRKQNVLESLASKPSKSTAPKKEIIRESNELASRFQKLANIKK